MCTRGFGGFAGVTGGMTWVMVGFVLIVIGVLVGCRVYEEKW